MCRTEQVLLLSDDLTSTLIMLINTSFNFGLKIKHSVEDKCLFPQILLQRMFPIMNLLVYSQNLNAGGHNISGFCGQFILIFYCFALL